MASGIIQSVIKTIFKAASGNITGSTIDSYKTTGIYHGYFTSVGTFNGWGILIVCAASATIEQIQICRSGIAVRHSEDKSTWSTWKTVALSE